MTLGTTSKLLASSPASGVASEHTSRYKLSLGVIFLNTVGP